MNLGRKVLDQALKLLVVLDVQASNALPSSNEQSDGCDFARQRETRHRRFHSSGQASFVEILKGSACSGSQVAAP